MGEEPDYNKEELMNRMGENSGEAPRYGKGARYAARAALVLIVLALVFCFYGMMNGLDAGMTAITSLAALILLPVLLFFLVWSLTRMHARSWEASGQALRPDALPVDTVVFDIGNVLAAFSWEKWLAEGGLPEETQKRIAQASVKDPVWNEIDRGVWTYEEFVDGIVKNAPDLETEIREQFARDYFSMISKYDYAIPWVKALKDAGYRVYYLSNFSERAHRECMHAMGFLDLMDGGIFSYTEKVIKPDEAIYRLLIDRYAIIPERAVFLDDRKENVDAAKKLGFRGIVFQDKQQADRALQAIDVRY